MNLELPVQDGLAIQPSEQDFSQEISFDQVEAVMMDRAPVECHLEHIHVPGLYVRRLTMPAGCRVASKIHKTQHPFVILKGDVTVWTEGVDEPVRLTAPYSGITLPGTRRLLHCHTETVWQTYHCNPDNETVDQIEERIIEPHYNPFVGLHHAEMARLTNHDHCILHND